MKYMFFCLETKEPKIQDLEPFTKNLNLILKFPKLARITIDVSIQNSTRAQTVGIF